MDNEWQYFYESLKRNGLLTMCGPGIDSLSVLTRPAAEYRKIILDGYRNYRHSPGEVQTGLEELLKLHTKICKERPADWMLKRRHNVLVYKCMTDRIAGDDAITKRLAVSKMTLYNDLYKVTEELTVLCLGVLFLMAGVGGQQLTEAVLQRYPLLIQSGAVMNADILFPVKLQPEVKQSRKFTVAYLDRFRECVNIYIDYCVNAGRKIESRRKTVLQEVCLSGQKLVKQFAKDYNYSLQTIYTDMKIIARHLGELMELVEK